MTEVHTNKCPPISKSAKVFKMNIVHYDITLLLKPFTLNA